MNMLFLDKRKLFGIVTLLSLLSTIPAVYAQEPFVKFPETLDQWPKFIVTGIFPVFKTAVPDEAFQGLNPLIFIIAPLAIYGWLLWDFFNFIGFPTQQTTRKWLAVLFTLTSLGLGIVAILISWIWVAGGIGVVALGGVAFLWAALGKAFGWGKGWAAKKLGKESEQEIKQAEVMRKELPTLSREIGRLDAEIKRFEDSASMTPDAAAKAAIEEEIAQMMQKRRALVARIQELQK